MCMSNTDLSAVCGTSDPGLWWSWMDFWWIQQIWSHPVAPQCTEGRLLVGDVCFMCSHAHELEYKQRVESQPLSRDQTFLGGLWVYHHVWCFISILGLCFNLERKQRYGQWEGSQPLIWWVNFYLITQRRGQDGELLFPMICVFLYLDQKKRKVLKHFH